MKTILILTLAICLACVALLLAQNLAAPLLLQRCLPLEGPENAQPSGLALRNDTLFSISDKHDTVIFRIELRDTVAALIPAIIFRVPGADENSWFDYEGITCDPAGNFYLVSESQFRILRVSGDGRTAEWITPELKSYGVEKGLFQVFNAYFEGIAWLAPNRFILAAERQPRGFVEVELWRKSSDERPVGENPPGENPLRVNARQFNEVKFPFAEGRSPDFADLCRYRNDLYVLERNAFVVTRLIEENGEYRQGEGWSYGHVETDPQWRYNDTRFGLAEGLCMDDRFIYIVLDNNGDFRRNNPRDRRPLLFILERAGEQGQ